MNEMGKLDHSNIEVECYTEPKLRHDEFLSSSTSAKDKVFERCTTEVLLKDKKYLLPARLYDKQYSQIYFTRLKVLQPILRKNALQTWPGIRISRILGVKEDEEVAVVGTIYKEQRLKPSILDEYAFAMSGKSSANAKNLLGPDAAAGTTSALDDHREIQGPYDDEDGKDAAPKLSYWADDDSVVLEDEGARMILRGNVIPVHLLVTGVVVAVKGRHEPGGDFLVSDWITPGFAPQMPLPSLEGRRGSGEDAAEASTVQPSPLYAADAAKWLKAQSTAEDETEGGEESDADDDEEERGEEERKEEKKGKEQEEEENLEKKSKKYIKRKRNKSHHSSAIEEDEFWKPRYDDKYVAFISGLGLGNVGSGSAGGGAVSNGHGSRSKDPNPPPAPPPSSLDALLRLDLALDFLAGRGGSLASARLASRVVRLVVLGRTVGRLAALPSATPYSRTQNYALQPLKDLDALLASLGAEGLAIDLMPGLDDPTETSLPQQPLHRCLLPGSTALQLGSGAVRLVTNPHEIQLDGVDILCTSGQNVDDVARYGRHKNSLTVMERLLTWRHVAPTAPDTLACFPFSEDDPFILRRTPHVYVAGNQPRFMTKVVYGKYGLETEASRTSDLSPGGDEKGGKRENDAAARESKGGERHSGTQNRAGLSQGMSQGMSQRMSQGVSQGMSQGMSQKRQSGSQASKMKRKGIPRVGVVDWSAVKDGGLNGISNDDNSYVDISHLDNAVSKKTAPYIRTVLLSVPSFAESGTIVLMNLRTLRCHPIKFEGLSESRQRKRRKESDRNGVKEE